MLRNNNIESLFKCGADLINKLLITYLLKLLSKSSEGSLLGDLDYKLGYQIE